MGFCRHLFYPDIDTPLKIEFVSIKETFTSVPSHHHLRCFQNILPWFFRDFSSDFFNFLYTVILLWRFWFIYFFVFWILVSYCLLGSAWLHGSFYFWCKPFQGENSAGTEACHIEIWFFSFLFLLHLCFLFVLWFFSIACENCPSTL